MYARWQLEPHTCKAGSFNWWPTPKMKAQVIYGVFIKGNTLWGLETISTPYKGKLCPLFRSKFNQSIY